MKSRLKYYIHRFKRCLKQPIAIKEGCVACGKCLKICPMPGSIVEGKPYCIDVAICMRCGKCVEVCPVEVIVKV